MPLCKPRPHITDLAGQFFQARVIANQIVLGGAFHTPLGRVLADHWIAGTFDMPDFPAVRTDKIGLVFVANVFNQQAAGLAHIRKLVAGREQGQALATLLVIWVFSQNLIAQVLGRLTRDSFSIVLPVDYALK